MSERATERQKKSRGRRCRGVVPYPGGEFVPDPYPASFQITSDPTTGASGKHAGAPLEWELSLNLLESDTLCDMQ